LSTLLITCKNKERVTFYKYFDKFRESNFEERYRGYENNLRRNCIFFFSRPDNINTVYKLNNGEITIINSDGRLNDSNLVKSQIEEVLSIQSKYYIIGFISDSISFRSYFKLDNIDEIPIELKGEEKNYYGVLLSYKVNIEGNSLLKRIHNTLKAVKIDENWYFYIVPAAEGFENCN
jgi:hypothetical protein